MTPRANKERASRFTHLNFIEILLSELFEIEMSGVDNVNILSIIVHQLEDQICALSVSFPQLKVIYKQSLRDIISSEYPDLPLPEVIDSPKCLMYSEMLEWGKTHRRELLKRDITYMDPQEIERSISRIVSRFVKIAILAAIYKAGFVRMRI